MAYTHSKYEVVLTNVTSGLSCTTSGDKAAWGPGMVPHVVRGVGITFLTSGQTVSALSCSFNHLNQASGSTASAIATLVGTSSDKSGHVLYKTVTTEVTINPGESVVFNNSAVVSGVCNVRPFVYVEPKWEQPGNITSMRQTT